MDEKLASRAFWLLAGPMIITNVSLALLGLVDTAVIGHLDSAVYLGGVAIGSVIFDFLYWGMGFLRMGTTGFIAQSHGQQDTNALRTVLGQSLIIGTILAILILVFQSPIIDAGLYLLDGSEEVKHYANIYCRWMIWGAPALIVIYSIVGFLLGMQNAISTLKLAVFINSLNIILDIVFVVGFEMDVKGVALASVISQYMGVLLGLWFVKKELNLNPGVWIKAQILNLEKLKRFLSLNNDIFLRTICLILVFAFFTREGAKHGDLILAANSILMKFYLLMALALDGFNHAAEALVGKAVGARNKKNFILTIKLALKWSLVFGTAFTIFYWIAGHWIINTMTDLENVRELAKTYLPWMIAMPLVSIWCFLLDGVFIGATRGKEMRNSMLACTFLFFLPLWYVFQFLGNHGLWLAFTLFILVRGITLGLYYYYIEKKEGFI